MVVGQDWSSRDALAGRDADDESVGRGFSSKFPTNANLDELLNRHFGLARAECYLTNLSPFIKPGAASASIPIRLLYHCAREFTLPEIDIVAPDLVLALGLRTFRALRRGAMMGDVRILDDAINAPFRLGPSRIQCVAHTGAFGINNRGRDRVELDWSAIATAYRRR